MVPYTSTVRVMPDIASEVKPKIAGDLNWVGMQHIEVPVLLATESNQQLLQPAQVTAYVNMHQSDDIRGIHMSRLYLLVDRGLSEEPLNPASMRRLLKACLDSHIDLADRAYLKIDFDYLIRRKALVSDHMGWRAYPISITGILDKHQNLQLELSFSVDYSSTCPCSAALARQLIQERFKQTFPENETLSHQQVLAWLGTEEGMCATPHAQRSRAEMRIKLAPSFANFPIIELIDLAENILKTPVQSAVKREDEQAFALLNGSNLMFCEDAARRLQDGFNQNDRIVDFWVRATHFESLHPHNAVAITTKGIADGYTAN